MLAASIVPNIVAHASLPRSHERILRACYVTNSLVDYIVCEDFPGASVAATFLNLPRALFWWTTFGVFAVVTGLVEIAKAPNAGIVITRLPYFAFLSMIGPAVIVMAVVGFSTAEGGCATPAR